MIRDTRSPGPLNRVMRRLIALVPLLVLAAACGGPGAGLPSSTTLTLELPSASPSPPPSPSPSPTALTSAKGAITVKAPAVNARLSSPFTVTGDASVFEATVEWRLSDTAARVIASGFTTASAGAPGRGTYTVNVSYSGIAAGTTAFVEVFSRSAKDGAIEELVRVPVTLN